MGIVDSGFMVVANSIDQTLRELDKRQVKALEAVGIIVERHARKNAPKDTGDLARSITHKVDNGAKTVTIGSDLDYALLQEVNENQNHRVGRSPYLRPAISENIDEIEKKIKEILENG